MFLRGRAKISEGVTIINFENGGRGGGLALLKPKRKLPYKTLVEAPKDLVKEKLLGGMTKIFKLWGDGQMA